MDLHSMNMIDNIVELYVAFYKLHSETYHTIFDEVQTENFAKQIKLDTVDKYMFWGLFNDYSELIGKNRNVIYEELKKNNNLHSIVDDIFCRCWG